MRAVPPGSAQGVASRTQTRSNAPPESLQTREYTKQTATPKPQTRFNPVASPPTTTPVLPRGRTPLGHRSANIQNVATLTRLAAKAKMSSEKFSTASATRMQTSSVGPGAPKLVTKGGLPSTPKLAPRLVPAGINQNLTPTPISRRVARTDTIIQSSSALLPAWALKEDPAAAGASLGSNVTVRSGQRQSRVDSASSTPNGTPNLDRYDVWDQKSGLGLSLPGPGSDGPRRPTVSFNPAILREVPTSPGPDDQFSIDSKFFYASDAKVVQQANLIKPTSQKSQTFVYANGQTVESRTTSQPSQLISAAPREQDVLSSRSVLADIARDSQPTPRAAAYSNSPSNNYTSPRAALVRSSALPPAGATSATVHRSPSPSKLTSQPPTVVPKTIPAVPLNFARSPVVTASGGTLPGTVLRPTGVGDALTRAGSHSRSGSVVAISSVGFPAVKVGSPVSLPEAASPTGFAHVGLGLDCVLQQKDTTQEANNGTYDMGYGEMHGPTKSSHADSVNELVSNARRERKVQDLEITNASLEAINRTLERQLRKQTSELRRYRRLSRSGRLSLPATFSTREGSGSSGTSVDIGSGETIGFDVDEEAEDESEEDDDLDGSEYSDTDSTESGGPGPRSSMERNARVQRRDEKRLQLDLSRHRQLLVDSQKMNQSLKRCLDWTEELIKEGQKALAYYVPVSDVRLGGRVLPTLDEVDEDREQPSRPASPAGKSETWAYDGNGRDSGVELTTER